MSSTRTFAMIKPDAIAKRQLANILTEIIGAGFCIRAMKITRLSTHDVEQFYAEHKGKDFFMKLSDFMSSGPIVPLVLEKDNAVANFRQLIGATDPAQAAEGTIRKKFAQDKTRNAIHGADSDASAKREWSFFFAERDII